MKQHIFLLKTWKHNKLRKQKSKISIFSVILKEKLRKIANAKKIQTFEKCVFLTAIFDGIWIKSEWRERWFSIVVDHLDVVLRWVKFSSFWGNFRLRNFCWISGENFEIVVQETLFWETDIWSNIYLFEMKSTRLERWKSVIWLRVLVV